MNVYSGMAIERLQVLTFVLIVWLKLTYGIIIGDNNDEYNSIYNMQLEAEQNHEIGRFPFLMPNVSPKTVSPNKKFLYTHTHT